MSKLSNWHIISYPRSGNHAVRSLIEYLTQRPTVPALGDAGDDKEIYLRKANQESRLIEITDQEPIGYKAHFLREILENEERSPEPCGLILITRDPAEAIVSHLYPKYEKWQSKLEKRRLWFSGRRRKAWEEFDWQHQVRKEFDVYIGCVFGYLAWKGRPRIHLTYEDLIDDGFSFCQTLAQKIGSNRDITRSEIESVLSLSKNSLTRKGGRQRDPKLVQELKAMVGQYRNYDQISELLQNW